MCVLTVIFQHTHTHTHNPARKCYSHFICKAGTVSVAQRVNCVAYGTFSRVDKACVSPIYGHCKWLLIVAFFMWTFSKTQICKFLILERKFILSHCLQVMCKLNTIMQVQLWYKQYQLIMLMCPTFWKPFCLFLKWGFQCVLGYSACS